MEKRLLRAMDKNNFLLKDIRGMLRILVFNSLDDVDDDSPQMFHPEDKPLKFSKLSEDDEDYGDDDDADDDVEPLEFHPRYIT